MALNINGTTGISGVDGSASAPALQGTDSNTGINFASDTVNINTGGSTRVTVDSNGRLGIGKTDPSYPLVARRTDAAGIVAEFANSGGYGLTIGQNSATGEAYLRTGTGQPLAFVTNSGSGLANERMRITSDGFLKAKGNASGYINSTGPYHELNASTANQLVLNTKHTATTGYGILMEFNHGNSSYYALQIYNYASGSNNMYLRTDGDLENINNSYGGISDVKLKENIVDAESQWNDIKALKVRNYNLKADESKTKLLGLVAQEAEAVCPSLVKSQPDLDSELNELGTETKVVKYSILYMKAIKALQEAQARIEVLETKVAALEAG